MAVEVRNVDGSCVMEVGGELTIQHAAVLKQELLAPLAECRECDVSLAAVSEIDSAGVQLLLLLKSEAQARGVQLRLMNHSRHVADMLDFCNLVAHFGDPLVIPSSRFDSQEGE